MFPRSILDRKQHLMTFCASSFSTMIPIPHKMVYHQNRVENEIYVIDGSAQGQEMQMPYLDIREIRSRPPGGMKNTKI